MEAGNGTTAYRLSRVEADLEKKADNDDLERIAEDIASVRRLLIGLLVTIVGFSLGALFLVAQLNAASP